MSNSLSLNTPPSTSNKRQRSRESRNEPSRSSSSGPPAPTPFTEEERLARSGIKMPAYLSKSKTEIQASFQDLEWKQRYRLVSATTNPNSPFRVDRSLTVINRNRYGNVQPWENTRVKLATPIHGSDYINASPIKLRSLCPKKTQRGRFNPSCTENNLRSSPIDISHYIATQGPKADQFSHFWHMVMQQASGEVGVIIMLTQCYEGLKEKCSQYFPIDKENPILTINPEPKRRIVSPAPITNSQEDGEDPFLDSPPHSISADTDISPTGPPQTATPPSTDESGSSPPPPVTAFDADHTDHGTVTLISLTHDSAIGCEVRELQITIGTQTKTIYHYFYGSWADFGRPEAEDRIALLQLMRTSRQVAGPESPRIVHCSAGVGRTGTWIALDFLLRECEEGRLVDSSVALNVESETEEVLGIDDEEGGKGENGEMERSRSRRDENVSADEKGGGEVVATATWGNSGPPKSATPEPKDVDVIHDTVDRLRTQRMMMVMNELQYTFLYEVLKEVFMEKYAEKEVGAVVVMAKGEANANAKGVREGYEPSLKVPRVEGVAVGRLSEDAGDEDMVSEAETEIQEVDGGGVVASGDRGAEEVDPYAAVAPENISNGREEEG